MSKAIQANLEYAGKHNPKPGEKLFNSNGQPLYPYIPSDELKESVKLAIALNRPLLLMGDPGCGKTKLASALAYEFTQNNAELLKQHKLEEWPLFTWSVKSTSKAKDGLYTYDAIARLRDSQLANSDLISDKEKIENRLKDETQAAYIKYGPLGEALRSPVRAIALIDEIDKADIDFPNDLLMELEEQRFQISETQTWVPETATTTPPIVIITSNNERSLPDAFLRRCFFHFFEQPEQEDLEKIIYAHFNEQQLPQALTTKLLESYLNVRQLGQERAGGKRVGTSELLDWVNALLLNTSKDKKVDEISKLLEKGLPYAGVLLKTRDEQLRYEKSGEKKSADDA